MAYLFVIFPPEKKEVKLPIENTGKEEDKEINLG